MTVKTCAHLAEVERRAEATKPSGHGCVECLATGGDWVHLRLCMACGHVGCCDSSPGQHATHHSRSSGHAVCRSYEPGEDWAYCYVDEAYLEVLPAKHGEAATKHYEPPRRR